MQVSSSLWHLAAALFSPIFLLFHDVVATASAFAPCDVAFVGAVVVAIVVERQR